MFEIDSKYIDEMLVKMNAERNVLRKFNDVRNGDTFALIFKDIFRYAPKRKAWFYYDGKRWIKDEGNMVISSACKQYVGRVDAYARTYIPFDDDNNWLHRNALMLYKLPVREKMIKDAQTLFPIDVDEFDSNPYLLNLENGTFDLKKGEFREHRADDLITKLAPVEFNQGATLDRWDSFILQIMSEDREKAEFLQKALGYSLSGSTNEECMFILYGATTRNGKGTLMESVLGVVGDYGKSVKPETIAIANKSSNSHSEDIARLQGVRLANISEPPKNMFLNSALVKSLTGGDTINARFLHENSFEFKPQFKLFVNTNYLPKIDDATVFMSNRIHIIPFDRHFSADEQEKTLKEQFSSSEAKSAILNWLIAGYYMAKGGFAPPKSVVNATKSYQQESEPVYKFINTVLKPDSVGRLPVAEAHRKYTSWASGNNEPILTQREFGSKLRSYVEVKQARVGSSNFKCIIGYSI